LLKYRTSTAYSRSAAANSAPPFAACLAKTNLTLTGPRPTGVRCVPSLFHDRSSWPKVPVIDTDGDENWLAEVTGRDIAFIPAKAGDLIVWDWRLPHSNSKTLSTRPRLALRDTAIESWRGSRCVPWWWRHRGYDRIEPRPSARLSELDRRLIGLHAW
jgi:hypothetical protein